MIADRVRGIPINSQVAFGQIAVVDGISRVARENRRARNAGSRGRRRRLRGRIDFIIRIPIVRNIRPCFTINKPFRNFPFCKRIYAGGKYPCFIHSAIIKPCVILAACMMPSCHGIVNLPRGDTASRTVFQQNGSKPTRRCQGSGTAIKHHRHQSVVLVLIEGNAAGRNKVIDDCLCTKQVFSQQFSSLLLSNCIGQIIICGNQVAITNRPLSSGILILCCPKAFVILDEIDSPVAGFSAHGRNAGRCSRRGCRGRSRRRDHAAVMDADTADAKAFSVKPLSK